VIPAFAVAVSVVHVLEAAASVPLAQRALASVLQSAFEAHARLHAPHRQ